MGIIYEIQRENGSWKRHLQGSIANILPVQLPLGREISFSECVNWASRCLLAVHSCVSCLSLPMFTNCVGEDDVKPSLQLRTATTLLLCVWIYNGTRTTTHIRRTVSVLHHSRFCCFCSSSFSSSSSSLIDITWLFLENSMKK